MSSNFIEEAKDLSEIMAALRDELLEDLEAAGKRALFEEAIQILGAQADAVESQDDLLALAQNIHQLVSQTPELQDLIPDELSDDDAQMSFDEYIALEVQNQERLNVLSFNKNKNINHKKLSMYIKGYLLLLVPNANPPEGNNLQSLFDKALAELRLQRR